MTTLTKSTGTVTLTGAVEKVTLPAAYGWVWVKNMSDGDMFVGLSESVSAGADGVMRIPAGECGRVQTDGFNSFYLLGTGNALVVAQNYADCPFKVGGKGGESPDLSAYAKKSDVPNIKVNSAVNADTVGGHKVGIDVPVNAVFTDTTYAVATASADGLMSAEDKVKLDGADDTYALKSKYGDLSISVGRKSGDLPASYSFALGEDVDPNGVCTIATGGGTTAFGNYSFAEGLRTNANGTASHAEGIETTANSSCSHTSGFHTIANNSNEFACGKYNVSDENTLFSVGDGTADDARHNAFEITKTGGMLHDKDILTSAHCIQFIPHNMKYYAQNDRILLFSNDDAVARGIYFVNNTPNDVTVCALISASAEGPAVQYGYGSSTYPEIQNTGDGREWFSEESIPTSPTIFAMSVPSGKLGYYGIYHNSETAYTTVHDIRCPYFNFF